MLARQDVGYRIQTTETRVKDCGPKTEVKDHGVSKIVSPDAAVLISDHSIVLQMASFSNSPQTELSKDAIRNTIEWWFVGVESTRWPSVFSCYHKYCSWE